MPTPLNLGQFRGSDNLQTYHLFIVYHDTDRSIVYRGGPARGSRLSDLVAEGLAQHYQAPSSEIGDIDWPFDNLITNRMEGLARDYDYTAWIENGSLARHMVTMAEGPEYCGLDPDFTRETRRVGMLGRTCNAVDIDRTDNSNATVYTILTEMGLPLTKPDVHAPGWGTNRHTETTVVETAVEAIQQPIREIEQEINRFERLSPIDQVNLLRRMFGMP